MQKHFLQAVLAAAIAGLSACGGGEDGTPTDPSNTASTEEVSFGSVTGFGSVIVDGTRYEDDEAQITEETAAGVDSQLTLDDVELGMQVEVTADAEQARTIVIRTSLIASIESLQSDGFTAAGQRVRVSEETIYSGTAGLADLTVGTRVAVHGTRDADDVIEARRVAVRPADTEPFVRIVGIVRDLDENAQTFRLGNLTVDYSNDPRVVPAGASLAEGRGVVVFGSAQPNVGSLQANGIRVLRAQVIEGRRIRVAGLIRDLDSSAVTFRLHVSTIDASEARFLRGTAADLANGRRARVLGVVQLNADGERFIKANAVWVGGSDDDATTVAGPVRNFVSAASFTIRGVPIDASGENVRFVNGTADNLADGVLLRVIGAPDGEKITATQVTFFEPDQSPQRTIAGFIRNANPADSTLQIFGVSVKVLDTTTVYDANGNETGTDALQNGIWAVARGEVRSGQLVANEIRLRNGTSIVVDRIEGVAYRVNVSNGRFWLNGVAIRVDDQLFGTVAIANLRSGHRVRVSGRWVNGELVVTSITRI